MITGSPNTKQYTIVFNDITNDCNLRCVFCPSPFSGSKNNMFMNEELFQKVMTLLPLAPDGNFVLSCGFEPTIHPHFTELLKSIPMQYRRKVCFTTNLARRNLSDVLIEELSQSSLHHINISLDSFDAGVYESLRRGARFSDFINNLERLTRVFSRSCSAPPIRYITVVCRSNIDEVPSIVEKCAKQYLSAENEFRYFWITDRCDRQWVKDNTVTYEEWKDMANKLSKLPYRYSLAAAPGLSPPDPSSSSSEYDRFISEIQDPQKRAVHTIPPAPHALWIQSTGRVDVFGYDVHFDLNNISEPYDFFKNLLEILWLSTERANELRLFVAEALKLRGETAGRRLSEMESRIHGLKVERERLVDELSDIRSSFGYKLMRFYAPKIDRICPEGTMRGQLIRIIRRIISGEHNLPSSD